jgi:hypothetical protein
MSSRSFDAAIFWEMDWVGLRAGAEGGVVWATAGIERNRPAARTIDKKQL